MVLKAADFGQMGDGVSAGTEILTAPEVFTTQKHGAPSDIFSLGLSAAQLVSGIELQECVDAYQKSVLDEFMSSSDMSNQIKQIIAQCTNEVASTRPTAD